ncbi:dihydrolipoamide acetyltransferase family protein [Isoptericola jiangsuensis]|uniref:dihydrolipoamide acetyltransferase family protein n=1 Tax=Isoptericola jiangsuensis TaxID=548579 RepID=UPI003AABE983
MTAQVFRLPDLGEGLTESEIVEWQVAAGDVVVVNQVIAEVETAKALVDLPSPYAGTVRSLHAEEGTVVHVGEPLITVDSDDGAAPDADADPDPEVVDADPADSDPADAEPADADPADADPAGPGANLVGYGARPARAGRPTRRPRAKVEAPATPSGTRRPAGGEPGGAVTREPVRGVRARTAAAMVASAAIPQATVHLTCDVTAALDLLERARPHARGERLTLLTLVAHATCTLLPAHPALATRWVESDDGPQLERAEHVDLGIAVATERGLVVPHVADADTLSLLGLARALTELVGTARAGRTAPDRLRSGTLTLTNVGVFGVDAGSPLLNPGESAILGIGRAAARPWEHRGEVALRQVVTLSLTFDHRVVDGEQGARFLADLGAVLTDPAPALVVGPHPDGPGRP